MQRENIFEETNLNPFITFNFQIDCSLDFLIFATEYNV